MSRFLVLCLLAGACSAARFETPARPPPPRRIGDSILHTQLCQCTTCNPASCCSDEGLSSRDGEEVLGLAVSSCEPRCTVHAWRISDVETCAAKRPPACCAG